MSIAVARAIGTLEDVNLDAQTTAALTGITMAPALMNLEQAWMEKINLDALNYANDTRASVGDPSKGVNAAEDNEQMSLDQAQSDLDTGNFQNIMETLKSIVSYLGNNLKTVLTAASPINQLMEATLSQIMKVRK